MCDRFEGSGARTPHRAATTATRHVGDLWCHGRACGERLVAGGIKERDGALFTGVADIHLVGTMCWWMPPAHRRPPGVFAEASSRLRLPLIDVGPSRLTTGGRRIKCSLSLSSHHPTVFWRLLDVVFQDRPLRTHRKTVSIVRDQGSG